MSINIQDVFKLHQAVTGTSTTSAGSIDIGQRRLAFRFLGLDYRQVEWVAGKEGLFEIDVSGDQDFSITLQVDHRGVLNKQHEHDVKRRYGLLTALLESKGSC